MLFGHVIQLITDDTLIYLTNKNEEVIERKTAENFKKDGLAAWLEIRKIEPIDSETIEIQTIY